MVANARTWLQNPYTPLHAGGCISVRFMHDALFMHLVASALGRAEMLAHVHTWLQNSCTSLHAGGCMWMHKFPFAQVVTSAN